MAWTRGLATSRRQSSNWALRSSMVSRQAATGSRPTANEGSGEEEVLPDIAERTLDLAFGLGPIGAAGSRHDPIVVQQRHQRGVVGHHAVLALADHRRLHPVVEDLLRRAAHGREGGDVTAHHGVQVLTRHEPPPEPPAVTEDDREQPDLPRRLGLVGERDREFGEVDLACRPGGVSKRRSNCDRFGGRTSRRKSVTAV